MNRIELRIKAVSPLAIGRRKPGGSISEVEDYIPGTVIRGAIAGQILRESGRGSEDLATQGGDFESLFLSDQPAIFQNAYPAILAIKNQPRTIDIFCLPATALSSKTNPGFTTKKGADGAFDTLIDRFCAESYGYPHDPCTLKGERVDNFSGFYCRVKDRYFTPSTSKRLLTRVGINRRRATAEDDILYSIEVLNESKLIKDEPVVYKSAILLPDEQLAGHLQQYIRDRATSFRLGGSISRGLGAVEIITEPPAKIKFDVQARIHQFNKTLNERWEGWRRVFRTPLTDVVTNRTFFTLSFQADAILAENWQRTMVISETMLKQFAGVQDESLQLHASYSSYDYRGGWNAAWGLMKDIELVTNKGSVYLFSTTNPNAWWQALSNLELKGVGERTSEGFGQVRVCDEFHLIFREAAK
ncbi:CRISPR-associated RAMP protein Csx10 [Cyanobacteria bacterium FACHB-DQ100]|nr:CRISPR-associated RAMP protein Csx10 [Cyanobacteria bacterium FACHB-DQ100]